jgi:hypothetical protein
LATGRSFAAEMVATVVLSAPAYADTHPSVQRIDVLVND